MTVKKIKYIQNATVMYVMCDDMNSVLRNQTGNEAFGVCKHALNQEGNLKTQAGSLTENTDTPLLRYDVTCYMIMSALLKIQP